MMIFRWLSSATVRQANATQKHVQKILDHQRDILTPKAVAEVEAAIRDTRDSLAKSSDKAALEKQIGLLEETANRWLKPYPHAAWRENLEVLLVALAVAMAIRTFFLQPFKIPTGSMQPTLYGVTSVPDFSDEHRVPEASRIEQVRLRDALKIPTGVERIKQWFQGSSYLHEVAQNDGELESVSQPVRFLIFNIKQTLVVGGRSYPLWFPPDYGSVTLEQRAGIRIGQRFQKGEDILRIRVNAGDHLFVDRLTYNFVPPSRGQIIVFETKGIPEDQRDHWRIPADQFYIKRLVGLGGETIQIGDDRHLVVNGKRLDAGTPHFENLYSFDLKQSPQSSRFSGHVNQKTSGQFAAPLFPDGSATFKIQNDRLMVMGDNTMNSLDSRFWGDFPANSVIGRAFWVYWPITTRFGWSCLKH